LLASGGTVISPFRTELAEKLFNFPKDFANLSSFCSPGSPGSLASLRSPCSPGSFSLFCSLHSPHSWTAFPPAGKEKRIICNRMTSTSETQNLNSADCSSPPGSFPTPNHQHSTSPYRRNGRSAAVTRTSWRATWPCSLILSETNAHLEKFKPIQGNSR